VSHKQTSLIATRQQTTLASNFDTLTRDSTHHSPFDASIGPTFKMLTFNFEDNADCPPHGLRIRNQFRVTRVWARSNCLNRLPFTVASQHRATAQQTHEHDGQESDLE
jgi:hypothetical protein